MPYRAVKTGNNGQRRLRGKINGSLRRNPISREFRDYPMVYYCI